MGCKVQTATAMFNRSHASQLACMYRFGVFAGHMCMQSIVKGAIFIAYILYMACHHLSQYHGGPGISCRSEEPHHGQLPLFLLLFAFACTFCTAGLYGALVGLGSGVRMGTWERPRVEPELKPGKYCTLLFIFFTSMGVWHEHTGPVLCLPMFIVGHHE